MTGPLKNKFVVLMSGIWHKQQGNQKVMYILRGYRLFPATCHCAVLLFCPWHRGEASDQIALFCHKKCVACVARKPH